MKKSFITLLIILFFYKDVAAQINTDHVRISILTCGPGDDAYSLWGHTAIRLFDSANNIDVVYNWGGFTFNQPNFYLKFLKGNLLYFSTADYFNDFMNEYISDNRSVYEQVLNIDSAAKKRMIDAIAFNSTGNNSFYKYDFVMDNCTTRVKNIVFDNNKTAVIKSPIIPEGTTYRDLIDYDLEHGNHLWIELGIDILLGSDMDKKVSNDEAMFLPEFFMKGLNNTENGSKPFVKSFRVILQGNNQQNSIWKFLPLAITTITCLLLFIISTIKSTWAKKITGFFDALLLYVTGLIGCLIFFMWFISDHSACKNNYNIAWALPTNFIIAFITLKKPAWLRTYFFIAAIITALLLATWFWLPQQLNIALLPVILLLLNRYINFTALYRNKLIRA